jgi:hypothetical protein
VPEDGNQASARRQPAMSAAQRGHITILQLGCLTLPFRVDWVASLLAAASTRVMINGTLRLKIWHACSLCQGALSPMLFLLVMEALSALIRKAD